MKYYVNRNGFPNGNKIKIKIRNLNEIFCRNASSFNQNNLYFKKLNYLEFVSKQNATLFKKCNENNEAVSLELQLLYSYISLQ